jgi:hypothetical protein
MVRLVCGVSALQRKQWKDFSRGRRESGPDRTKKATTRKTIPSRITPATSLLDKLSIPSPSPFGGLERKVDLSATVFSLCYMRTKVAHITSRMVILVIQECVYE